MFIFLKNNFFGLLSFTVHLLFGICNCKYVFFFIEINMDVKLCHQRVRFFLSEIQNQMQRFHLSEQEAWCECESIALVSACMCMGFHYRKGREHFYQMSKTHTHTRTQKWKVYFVCFRHVGIFQTKIYPGNFQLTCGVNVWSSTFVYTPAHIPSIFSGN